MTLSRELLSRYLRQRAELGEREVFLDTLGAADALALARGRATPPQRVAERLAAALQETAVEEDVAASASATADASALEPMRRAALACTRCRLCEGRSSVVFGEGSAVARVVVVGEAPGSEEDRTGRPFVGRAGKLLDQLLLSVGLPRERVFICNVLKCRPPDNRNPLPDEVERCAPFLHGQLEAIAPRVLIAVGKFAAQTLVGREDSISALRGRVHQYRGIPLIATYHPAFLLRSPQWIRTVWQDFQLMRQVLDGQA